MISHVLARNSEEQNQDATEKKQETKQSTQKERHQRFLLKLPLLAFEFVPVSTDVQDTTAFEFSNTVWNHLRSLEL